MLESISAGGFALLYARETGLCRSGTPHAAPQARPPQSSVEHEAGRFQLALGETGTGGGDAGRQIHLVRTHCGSGIRVRCDHLDAAALLAQGLDLACKVRAREFAQTLELASR